ncbi:MAG: hypothetical protein GEV11_04335 [Streptosporangiales bacterium]|nr:hypothetical protein [Streptosporangiales bacterium]
MTSPTSERQGESAPTAATPEPAGPPAGAAPQAAGATPQAAGAGVSAEGRPVSAEGPFVSEELSEEISRLVDERIAAQGADVQPARQMMTVAGWSLVLAIPISAFASLNAGVLGLGIAWLGIVLVNAVAATVIRRS